MFSGIETCETIYPAGMALQDSYLLLSLTDHHVICSTICENEKMKGFNCYDNINQFSQKDMASARWSTAEEPNRQATSSNTITQINSKGQLTRDVRTYMCDSPTHATQTYRYLLLVFVVAYSPGLCF